MTRVSRALSRRERHRSRSTAVVIALVLAALAAIIVGIEVALALLALPALLVAPTDALAALGSGEWWIAAGAGLLALLGLIAIISAVTPGRRSRHELVRDGMTVIVDDDVLASAISRSAAGTAGIPADQVTTTVGRRTARVETRPTSGRAIDDEAVRAATATLIDGLAPRPALRPSLSVSTRGVVGS